MRSSRASSSAGRCHRPAPPPSLPTLAAAQMGRGSRCAGRDIGIARSRAWRLHCQSRPQANLAASACCPPPTNAPSPSLPSFLFALRKPSALKPRSPPPCPGILAFVYRSSVHGCMWRAGILGYFRLLKEVDGVRAGIRRRDLRPSSIGGTSSTYSKAATDGGASRAVRSGRRSRKDEAGVYEDGRAMRVEDPVRVDVPGRRGVVAS
ncbi:hypothetical protein B0H17DRAFT_1147462 [Mycena rosella]|uniref:Uncharacterized protein n=1 Tax=Mycena rosella TaxID=1033263 RepID=A0AAD7CLR5_MYCRO|nr:hypothetical protein B0H17DRAFT_1147462 [Mycena rosella]